MINGDMDGLKSVPQRLKPRCAHAIYGTAEAVPFVQRLPHRVRHVVAGSHRSDALYQGTTLVGP
jgi:hypothetical protein